MCNATYFSCLLCCNGGIIHIISAKVGTNGWANICTLYIEAGKLFY